MELEADPLDHLKQTSATAAAVDNWPAAARLLTVAVAGQLPTAPTPPMDTIGGHFGALSLAGLRAFCAANWSRIRSKF